METKLHELKCAGHTKMTTKEFNAFALLDCVDRFRQLNYVARGRCIQLKIESSKLSPGVYSVWLKGFQFSEHGISTIV